MRPVRLEVRGFAAYRESQVLDFEDLDLFAITGPTGSGKSTLLDAITYALYGKAPRVGKAMSQLIAQGQPRLGVILEFEVDGRRYRVFRDTPTKGSSSIRLERRVDGEWRSFGEGADRIGEAGALIEGLIGLDYVGFNRSIVLPQGEFAGFLTGEAKDRRRILTQLLDLDMFERMGRRAGEVAREAKGRAEGKKEVLASQYGSVDKAALRVARKAAKDAAARSEVIAGVERSLEEMAKEWQGHARRIEALEALADEADELAASARLVAEGLERLAGEWREADARAASLDEAAKQATLDAEEAARAVAEAEDRLGTPETLAALRATLEELDRAEGRIATAEAALADARAAARTKELALQQAGRGAAEAGAALERAEATVKEAESEHERVHTADRVAALLRGKAAGDPCPVCERPLEVVPKVGARGLDEAVRMLGTARSLRKRVEAGWSKAERDVALAERDLQAVSEEIGRCERELAACRGEREAMVSRVEASFGGALPLDPLAELTSRTEGLRAVREHLAETEAAAKRTGADADRAREAARSVTTRTAELVGSLRGLPLARTLDRARHALPDLRLSGRPPARIPSEPRAASVAARTAGKVAEAVASALRLAATLARQTLDEILDRARDALPEGVPVALVTDMEQLILAVRAAGRQVAEAATVARKDAERLAQRLTERQEIEHQAKALEKEAAIHQALAGELRADRLIDFLQGEALELLAAGGSDRLLFLSQGRYRLVFDEDEFYVEDRQNGDERRSVRTLSGGETFLASLALALALSDQIQSLAVTTRARLESLFIDEGFGSLDPDVLEVASEALSQLGGQGRLVGVITHVSELAERLPVRIEVKKLPGGSRLERVS